MHNLREGGGSWDFVLEYEPRDCFVMNGWNIRVLKREGLITLYSGNVGL